MESFISGVRPQVNGSRLVKMKSTFLTCPCHEIYRVEVVGIYKKKIKLYLNKYDFCEYMKFGAIS